MTMTEQERPARERNGTQDPEHAARANRAHAAQQRDAAAAVNTAVAAARVERTRARHLGADARRLAEAFTLLSEQINGRDEMTVLEPGNVLRHGPGAPEAGTGNMAAVCEFVARIMRGELPYDALEEMHEARLERHLAPAVAHADATYQHAHRLEHAASVHPALPSGAAPANGAVLPHREAARPVAPESAVQSTGQIALRAVREMLAEGRDMPASQAALAHLDQVVQVFEVDSSFNPVSIPGQRAGDTQRLPVDEVLGHLARADAGAEADGDTEPRPFSGTGRSGDASPAKDGAGDDDA